MFNTNNIDWNRVLKFLGGGALLGGGAASTVALYRLLSRLGDKRDSDSSTAYDDDTLTINLPQKQASDKEASNSETALMSYVGAMLAGYLGYKGVDSIFNKIRQNQLQTELDQAQNIYMDRLGGTDKEASEKKAFSDFDNLGAMGYAAPLLIAIASGIITNKLLSKGRPALDRQGKRNKIRKLVIKKPEQGEIEEDDEALVGEENMEPSPEDLEQLMRVNMAKESRAKESGLADLVAKAASGEIDEFKALLKQYSFNDSLDLIKGAHLKESSDLEKNLAVSLLCHDPMIKEPLGLTLASEYYDMGAGICKAASAIEPELACGLIYFSRNMFKKMAKELYKSAHEHIMGEIKVDPAMVKSAVDLTDIGLLKMLLEGDPEEQVPQEEQEKATTLQISKSKDSSDPDISISDPDEEDVDIEANSEEAELFANENSDAIDSMLGAGGLK